MNWFVNLDEEELEFIKKLILSSGSLKELAKQYGVSYPTVRLRLDKLIEKIKIIEDSKNSFEAKIMQMVIDDKISLEIGKEIIKTHKEELK